MHSYIEQWVGDIDTQCAFYPHQEVGTQVAGVERPHDFEQRPPRHDGGAPHLVTLQVPQVLLLARQDPCRRERPDDLPTGSIRIEFIYGTVNHPHDGISLQPFALAFKNVGRIDIAVVEDADVFSACQLTGSVHVRNEIDIRVV